MIRMSSYDDSKNDEISMITSRLTPSRQYKISTDDSNGTYKSSNECNYDDINNGIDVNNIDHLNHRRHTKMNMRNWSSFIRQRKYYGISFCFICVMTFVGNNLLVSYQQKKYKQKQKFTRMQNDHEIDINEVAFLLSNLSHESTSSLILLLSKEKEVNSTIYNPHSNNNNNDTQSSMISNNGLDKSILSMTTFQKVGDGDNIKMTIGNTISNNQSIINNYLIEPNDFIYKKNGEWDSAPVVIEEYKLIFFTSAKVGCTVWKTLFRRMMNIKDWNVQNYTGLIPWNPKKNGLKYLYDYNITDASNMIQSTDWIKAIFVRDPKERFVSAFLDKAVKHQIYLYYHCCIRNTTKQDNDGTIPYDPECVNKNDIKLSKSNVTKFFHHIVSKCDDPHWQKQSLRMEEKYWQYINFVGNMETVTDDAERLLRLIGAWDEYGSNGWGTDDSSDGRIFAPKQSMGRAHQTNASDKQHEYISTVEFEAEIETFFKNDYTNPKLNLTLNRIFPDIEHEKLSIN